MRLIIKQFFALLLLISLLILIISIIPFLANKLSMYDISDLFLDRDTMILLSIFLHFFVGIFIINRINILKVIKNKYIILFFFASYIIFNTLIRLINNTYHFNSYLLEISLVCGIVIGLTFRNSIKKSLLISLITISVFLVFTKKITIPLANQFKSYGNYDGEIKDLVKIEKINLIDIDSSKVDILASNPKIVIIDFWNNNCALCFQNFPSLLEMQEDSNKDNNMIIIAVNIYKNKEDIKVSQELLYKTGNKNLINYFMSIEDSKKYNINFYPKTIVIKNKQIVFDGHLKTLNLFKSKYLY